MTADTRYIEIASDQAIDLETGMKLAFGEHVAKAYKVKETGEEKIPVLHFLATYVDDKGTPFPCPLTADVCIDVALAWLKIATYPSAPNKIDGGVKKGFIIKVSNFDAWEPFSLCTIRPMWMIYGK